MNTAKYLSRLCIATCLLAGNTVFAETIVSGTSPKNIETPTSSAMPATVPNYVTEPRSENLSFMEGRWAFNEGGINIEEFWTRENSQKLYCIRTIGTKNDRKKQEIFQFCDFLRGTSISGIQLEQFHEGTGVSWSGHIGMEPGELANLSLMRRDSGSQSEPHREVYSYTKVSEDTVRVTVTYFGAGTDSSYVLTKARTQK